MWLRIGTSSGHLGSKKGGEFPDQLSKQHFHYCCFMQHCKHSNSFLKILSEKFQFKIGLFLYRVSQEERSIFWEVIVSVILRKKFVWTCILF
jgi:hypothetical protein